MRVMPTPRPNRAEPGDEAGFSAEDWNRLCDEVERLAKLEVGGTLSLQEGPSGRSIASAQVEPFYALLSGSSSPYGWTEQFHQPGNTWIDGYRSGTASAYEVNGAPGLGGKRARLIPDGFGGYRFQFVRLGTAVCGSICTTVKNCDNTLAPGVSVTVTGPSSSGTCVTTGQVTSVTRTSAGSGYTSGTDYPLGFSGGGGTGAAGLFDVSDGVPINIRVTAGGSGYTSAPAVSFPGAGGSGATATATIATKCCVSGLADGTYTVTGTLGGSSVSTTITVSSCAPVNVSLTMPILTTGKVLVTGCGGGGTQGATVTLAGNGYSSTQTTGADGNATFTGVPTGTGYTITVSKARWTDATCTGKTVPCSNNWILICPLTTPAEGYVCCGCTEPVADTLFVTDANGTYTITYDSGWVVCYDGPEEELNCFNSATTQFSFCGSNPSTGEATKVMGNAAVEYLFFCAANGIVQLNQSLLRCQDGLGNVGLMTSACNGGPTVISPVTCDGTVSGQSVPSSYNAGDTKQQPCGSPPFSWTFTLAGDCHPCGDVVVSE